MTRTWPCRRMILHLRQMTFTDARTFMVHSLLHTSTLTRQLLAL
mgnify:CR=1 FL=1